MGERVTWGGRYAIYDELASGGMATIYLAARLGPDTSVPLVVALKKLADAFSKQPEFVAMFLDEAHLAARIRHPNVVATYEFLRTDEGLGIVMDLVVGESLMQLVRGRHTGAAAPAPVDVSLAIVTGMLDGLQAAHQIGDDSGKIINLVHRDVSPHNVIVGADGVARLIDFGIAKAAGRLQTTDVGVLKGKFAYMSPEQVRGAALDRRTDIYSTGIVLWESLVGRKLFRGRTNEELLAMRTSGTFEIPPPSSLNPDVSPALDALVLRALANDPSERFGSALAMAETIRADHDVASDGSVAVWVKSRAGERLAVLDAKRRQLEQQLEGVPAEAPRRDSLVASVGARVTALGEPLAAHAARAAAPPPPFIDVPEGVSSLAALPSVPSLPSPEPVAPESGPPAARLSRAHFGGDFELVEGASVGLSDEPLRVDHEPKTFEASMHAVPAAVDGRVSLARISVARPRKAAPRFRGGAFVLLFVLVATLGAGTLLEGPTLLRGRVLAAATARGLGITLERAELSTRGLVLVGVKGSLTGCPSVHFAAARIETELDHGGALRRLSIPGYELTLSGSASELAAELAAWRAERTERRDMTPLEVLGTAGHLLWSRPATPTLMVEALDTTLTMSPSTGPTITLDSPGLLVNLPRAHLGPWRLHVDAANDATRIRLGLDPSVQDGAPVVTLLQRPREGTTWSVDIPRGSTFKAGIPTDLFGLKSDLVMEVGLHGDLSATGDMFSAEGQVGLYGLDVVSGHGGGHVPLDVLVSGTLRGDPSKPLVLAGGKLAMGKGTSAVSGLVTLKDDGVRVELDRPESHAGAAPALSLDTREWTAAVKGTRPAKCETAP